MRYKALGLKSLWFFALALLVFIGAVNLGCGSGNTACGTMTSVVGNWKITVNQTVGGTVTGYGAVDSAGLALFFDNAPLAGGTGDTLEMPNLSGACAFSGKIVSYAQPGGPDSGTVVTDSAQGTINSAATMSGSFSGFSAGTFSVVSFSPLSGAVTAISGAKTGTVQGEFNSPPLPLSLALTFTPSGTGSSMNFTTTNLAGCEANGTFTQQATGNVFDVSITLMPGCPISGTFTGLGFESSTDYFSLNGSNADTYLYADILNGPNTFVMEIY